MKQYDITDDSPPSNSVAWNDVTNLFLHRIVVFPKILPYIDMVRWVVDHLDTTHETFITLKKTVIGSFKAEDLRKM